LIAGKTGGHTVLTSASVPVDARPRRMAQPRRSPSPSLLARPRTGAAPRPARLPAPGRGAGRSRRPRGQSVVELALVFPVAMMLLVLVTDAGRLFYTYIGVTNAAREGAAYGMSHPTCWSNGSGTNQCPNPANITYLARQELAQDASLSVSVACNSACATSTSLSGNSITVSTSRSFAFLFPLIPTMTISASATAVVQ
jgi:Flp pilus assembly protein TadG